MTDRPEQHAYAVQGGRIITTPDRMPSYARGERVGPAPLSAADLERMSPTDQLAAIRRARTAKKGSR